MIAPPHTRFLAQSLRPITIGADERPMLQVVIDTEEEFDWLKPFDRTSDKVGNVAHQFLAQRIFDRHRVRPTYVVDYAVSSQAHGYGPLRELFADGRCEIGAHLQPWINPPFVEEVNNYHSFAGNLPPEIERQKLEVLTESIERNIGTRPLVYRAGRYGLGPGSLGTLEDLGYEIDTSVLPATDLRRKDGPDYSRFDPHPFWFGLRRPLLGIPLSVGFTGLLWPLHRTIHPLLTSRLGVKLKTKAVASRLHLLDRVTISPEGATPREQMRLTRALLARGYRVFCLSYHSPSLVPGNTPYVRTRRDLERFLAAIEEYLDFFINGVKGRVVTAMEIKRELEQRYADARPPAPDDSGQHCR